MRGKAQAVISALTILIDVSLTICGRVEFSLIVNFGRICVMYCRRGYLTLTELRRRLKIQNESYPQTPVPATSPTTSTILQQEESRELDLQQYWESI
jgi:hypothetical protein